MIHKSLKEIILGSLPIMGEIKMYSGTTAPKGWMLCDGTAISRTSYAKLFDVIGTAYGAGDGSTTFNLPNLQGRVPIGVSSDHALATTGGAETHTLTATQIPAHTHGSKTLTGTFNVRSGPSNTYTVNGTSGIASVNRTTWSGSHGVFNVSSATNPVIEGTTINATHEHTSVGGNGAHNNMQPFLTINYIIYCGGGYCVTSVFSRLSSVQLPHLRQRNQRKRSDTKHFDIGKDRECNGGLACGRGIAISERRWAA